MTVTELDEHGEPSYPLLTHGSGKADARRQDPETEEWTITATAQRGTALWVIQDQAGVVVATVGGHGASEATNRRIVLAILTAIG